MPSSRSSWSALAERESGQDEEERTALQEAVSRYTGDLFPDCYDDWIVPERARLLDALLAAGERLADLLERQRDYRGAVPWARRLLDHEPLNEESCRRLMRLQALAGDRAGALRTYHGFATALARDTGVEPGDATREAYEHLLEAAATPAPMLGAAAATAISPLIGRVAEWATLRAAWRRAADGQSLLAVIGGEAGIGKSRLAEELLEWVERQGIHAAASRCYAAAGGLAYAPVVELLRSEAIGPAVRGPGDVWQTELARLLPELLDERPELASPEPLTDDWQRTRLLDALRRAVISEKRPLLVVIDDLQWADSETIAWLEYVLRSAPTAPLLVVATVRSEALDANHPAQGLLVAARRGGQAVELELGPLDPGDTAELAHQVSGRQLDESRNSHVYRESEGNPLFVVEWIRAGLLEQAPDAVTDDASAAVSRLPPKVQSVLEARLAQLSPAAQEIAALAATVGRAFGFKLLAQASSRGEDDVVEAIDELWQRRVVREQGVDGYDFSHDKLREAAYLRAGSARRQLAHRRVAEALERIHSADLDAVSGELALHYERAGQDERAIAFYARAAEVAERVFSHEGAIALFAKALELLDAQPQTSERDEQELALRTALGGPLVAIKGYGAPEVHDLYLRAVELCERLGTQPDPPALRALALVHVARGELSRTYELGERLLERGGLDRDPMLRVEGEYLLGVTSSWLGEFAAARTHLERAIADYAPERARSHLALYSQDPRIICLSRLAYVLRYLGEPDQAEEKAREALRLADELEHPFSLAYALNFSAWLAIEMGDEALARERAERMAALADEHRLGFMQPMGKILRGWVIARDGQTDDAIALIHQGLDHYAGSGWSLYQPYGFALLARVLLDAGRPDDARAAIAEAFDLSARAGQRYLEAQLYALKGEADEQLRSTPG